MAASLLYTPLSEESREIRVLEVISNTKIELSCSLHVVSLDENIPFAAISYVWGDPSDTEPIKVDDVVVFITKGLASAIRNTQKHLQNEFPSRPQRSFRLWADALCINQSNFAERSQQVQLMDDIFPSAEIVFSWLGHEQDDVMALAMDTMELVINLPFQDMSSDDFKSLRWLQDLQTLLREESSDELELDEHGITRENSHGAGGFENENWAAIYRLFTLPYWSRVWIFQEVVLAGNLLLTCPSRTLPVARLLDFLEKLELLKKLFTSVLFGQPNFISESTWRAAAGDIPSSHIQLLMITRDIGREARSKLLITGSHEQLWLISIMAAKLKATEPRDYIYGLLGVSHCNIIPDYNPSKSLFEVYKDYVVAWIEWKSNESAQTIILSDLYFLRYAGARFPPNKLSLTSWVPHYHEDKVDITIVDRTKERSADRGFEYHGAIHVSNRSLFVGGFQYSSISRLYDSPSLDAMYNGIMIKTLHTILTRHQDSLPKGVPGLQAILRLLAGDYELDKKMEKIDLIYALGFLSSLLLFASKLDGRTPDDILPLLGLSANPEDFTESFLNLFCPDFNLVESGINQNLFEIMTLGDHGILNGVMHRAAYTFSLPGAHHRFAQIRGPLGGNIALVNESALTGDVICILKGYDAPVLMRKVDDAWIYIGDCPVLGIMNGEAAKILDSGLAAVEEFEIR